jgi:hypothetical protein
VKHSAGEQDALLKVRRHVEAAFFQALDLNLTDCHEGCHEFVAAFKHLETQLAYSRGENWIVFKR